MHLMHPFILSKVSGSKVLQKKNARAKGAISRVLPISGLGGGQHPLWAFRSRYLPEVISSTLGCPKTVCMGVWVVSLLFFFVALRCFRFFLAAPPSPAAVDALRLLIALLFSRCELGDGDRKCTGLCKGKSGRGSCK